MTIHKSVVAFLVISAVLGCDTEYPYPIISGTMRILSRGGDIEESYDLATFEGAEFPHECLYSEDRIWLRARDPILDRASELSISIMDGQLVEADIEVRLGELVLISSPGDCVGTSFGDFAFPREWGEYQGTIHLTCQGLSADSDSVEADIVIIIWVDGCPTSP